MHKNANKFRIRIKKKSTQNFRNEQKRKKKQRIAGVSERVRKSDIHGETARAETGLFARRRVHTKGNSLRGSPCIFLPAPDDAVHEVPTARCSSGSCLAARYSHFYDGKERWGAIIGLIGAIVIESLGGSTFTILPILYTFAGYFCGILTTHYFRDSVATSALYTLVSTVARVFFTLIALFATTGNVTLIDALTKAALPEFFACIIFAPLPHIAAKMCLHRFNKSREERTHE